MLNFEELFIISLSSVSIPSFEVTSVLGFLRRTLTILHILAIVSLYSALYWSIFSGLSNSFNPLHSLDFTYQIYKLQAIAKL